MPQPQTEMTTREDQPLLGVLVREEGQDFVHYFTDEEEAEQPARSTRIQRALSALGSWRDLDWEAVLDALDRIRHDTPPTPPFEP